ncbi:TRAP transporter substrate-binding protein, partial [Chloroflexota bacterium]
EVRNESLQIFCDLIGVYSDGRIQVEFFPDALLGSHTEHFRGVQLGDIEFMAAAPYVDICPGGLINWIPWTVSSFWESEIANKAPDGIIFQLMQDAWNDVGCQLLWNSPNGGYGLGNTVRPLVVPDDLRDLTMRVSGSLGFVRTLENMGKGTGMTVTTLPWADVYGALERGVIDGSWNLWSTVVDSRHFEQLNYYTDLNFGWDTNNIIMHKPLWDQLPPELQDAVTRAARVAETYNYWAIQVANLQYPEFLVEAGLEIYYPTSAERDLWREAAQMPAVWAELITPYLDERYPGQDMTSVMLDELERIRTELRALGK